MTSQDCNISLLQHGLDLLQAGNLDLAYENFSKILATEKNPECYHMLAVIKTLQNDLTAAFGFINAALEIKPQNSAYHNTLAGIYLQQNNLEQAYKYYAIAVQNAPNVIDYRFNLSHVLFEQKNYTAALVQLKFILNYKLHHVHALRCITIIYAEKLQFDQLWYYAYVWQSLEKTQESYYYLGLAKEKLKCYQAAIKEYSQALEFDYNNIDVLVALSSCYFAQGEFTIAKEHCQQVLTLQPNNFTALNTMGAICLQFKEVSESKKYFFAAYNLHANSSSLCGLGILANLEGQPSNALDYFKQALAVDSNCQEAKILQANIYFKRYDFTRAWQLYQARIYSDDYNTNSSINKINQYPPLQSIAANNFDYLLIWAEQGIGDQVFYSGIVNYAINSLLANVGSGKKIILECDYRLVNIFKRSFPECAVISNVNDVSAVVSNLASNKDSGNLIEQISYVDLMANMITTKQDMVKYNCCLQADSKLKNKLRIKYKELFPGKKLIGIAWQTNNRLDGKFRSINIEEYKYLEAEAKKCGSKANNVQLISLQYGDVDEICKQLGIYREQEIDIIKDIDFLFAQIACLDKVLTIDCSILYFAKSLGVDVDILSPELGFTSWHCDFM